MITQKTLDIELETEDFQDLGEAALDLIYSLDKWAGNADDLLSNKDYWILWRAIDVLQRVKMKYESGVEPSEVVSRPQLLT
jgi:hypothetical protein